MIDSRQPSSSQLQLIPAAHCPGLDYHSLSLDLYRHYCYSLGQDDKALQPTYIYKALAMTVRERLVAHWKETNNRNDETDPKQVYYLSLEFLMGRALCNAIDSLDLQNPVKHVLHDYGMHLEDIIEREQDAGLGNGGLGRLAACFLDSCASLRLPVMGYGIRYEYGMFAQRIEDGYQVECPDHWLRDGNPWELARPEHSCRVPFYGHSEFYTDTDGRTRVRWVQSHDVMAVPYDTPVPGYRNNTVNTLRLWKAVATDAFDLGEFHAGSYPESVAKKNAAENITMVLYPNDASENGKQLRLQQQYFFVSASLQDILRRWVSKHGNDFEHFAEKNAFQLNDTHPSCAVPELMRLLIDIYGLAWDAAWQITTQTMAYTNHTLLPEALETWSVRLFGHLLPRLLDIIYEINGRFLTSVSQRWPGDVERQRRMSLIEEGSDPQIRMAYLALVASHSVNGVANLHTCLLQQQLFADFYCMWPEKFNNKTNGVTHRRWLMHCNPDLSRLITKTIGDGWQADATQLKKLRDFAVDGDFQRRWSRCKHANKSRLADYIRQATGMRIDSDAVFDVQVKRIHEYKRQLLNVLHVIHRYDRIRRGETKGLVKRCVLIGGKAAPGYAMAKLIIKLANNVAQVVNRDPLVSPWLKMVFMPNFQVSAMELICPAADLSEQISTAGKEASGTGNMKFMMNGALTIGTLDGANIEIREQAGEQNFFLFGLDAEAVQALRANYNPQAIIKADSDLARVMNLLTAGHFNLLEPGIFDPLINAIGDAGDPWMVAADFRSYIDTQWQVDQAYQDPERWWQMSILNTAASGWFSSDRTIRQYARDIWGLNPQ